jgi:hypothetical protein
VFVALVLATAVDTLAATNPPLDVRIISPPLAVVLVKLVVPALMLPAVSRPFEYMYILPPLPREPVVLILPTFREAMYSKCIRPPEPVPPETDVFIPFGTFTVIFEPEVP